MLKINGLKVEGKKFVFDGYHKIYILKNADEERQAKIIGYTKIYNIKKIFEIYYKSCSMRFISSWDLHTQYVKQFQNAIFEIIEG